MGQCYIVSRDARSRYTIAVDLGEANRSAWLTIVNRQLASLEIEIYNVGVLIDEADAKEAALIAAATAAFNAYAAAVLAGESPNTKDIEASYTALALERVKNAPLRSQLVALRITKSQALRRAAYLVSLVLTITKPAWRPIWESESTKLQTDVFGWTIDIPGTPDLQLLGGVGLPTNEVMTAMSVMSPEQAYWNVSVSPGWQKFKPTYRWGYLQSVNYSSSVGSVTLAPAVSLTQRLNINRTDDIVDAPIEYDDGIALSVHAFAPGDRVVVRFNDQDWYDPTIIGFLDNPIKGRVRYLFETFIWMFTDTGAATDPVKIQHDSGYISRTDASRTGYSPDIWKPGYYKIGWSTEVMDVRHTKTVTWDNEVELQAEIWSYMYVDMLNSGYGEDFSPPGLYTPFVSTSGPTHSNDWYFPLSNTTQLAYLAGAKIGVEEVQSNTYTYLTTRWTVVGNWGLNNGYIEIYTYLVYYCSEADGDTCWYAKNLPLIGTIQLDWINNHTGDVISSQTVDYSRSSGGVYSITRQAQTIWG